jgi:hypothetical protein
MCGGFKKDIAVATVNVSCCRFRGLDLDVGGFVYWRATRQVLETAGGFGGGAHPDRNFAAPDVGGFLN